ncbi:MAG: hypothetical protein KDF58_07195 [Alphaproteobacteria bacterium]|nr:hypothetical protein [Alphaproteobacteria bacterium]HPF45418.1 hypothetical protein [Emcibacteraceae bacterium]HRW28833.1 hypothetical protein [Emcibacteraceae bacterium]
MMIRKTVTFILVSLLSLSLFACDSNQEKHKKTLEEKLADSFSQSEETVKNRVNVIVKASEDKNYMLAMNELAILSASQINNHEQKLAIKLLMNQLRYTMEEEEIAAKTISPER